MSRSSHAHGFDMSVPVITRMKSDAGLDVSAHFHPSPSGTGARLQHSTLNSSTLPLSCSVAFRLSSISVIGCLESPTTAGFALKLWRADQVKVSLVVSLVLSESESGVTRLRPISYWPAGSHRSMERRIGLMVHPP